MTPCHKGNRETLLSNAMSIGRISAQDNVMVLGDFNARLIEWRDTHSNTAGRALHDWSEHCNLHRLDTGSSPTFTSSNGSSIIDHVFTNAQEAT